MREMDLGDDSTMTIDKFNLQMASLRLNGLKVVVSPLIQPVPRIQMRQTKICCSDQFADKLNQWLLDRFGTKDVAYRIGDNIVMSPNNYRALKIASLGL